MTGKPGGKQSLWYENRGCHYTRTTGIWQTVWMEPVHEVHLDRPRITPDLANSRFHFVQPITNSRPGASLRVTLKDTQGVVSTASVKADADFTPAMDLNVPADRRHLWSPQTPFLYDIEIELLDAAGKVIDRAGSYAGLRSVTIDGQAVKINGAGVFQRMVLDQGYYADGILTAPSDDFQWRPASMPPGCTRKCSRSDSCITRIGWATSSGASSPIGAWTLTRPGRPT